MLNCSRCYEVKVSCGSDSYTISGLTPLTDYWLILTDRFGNKYRLGTPDDNDLTKTDADGVFTFSMPDGMDDPHAGSVTLNFYSDSGLCFLITLTICEVEYSCISLSFNKMTSHSKSTLICDCSGCEDFVSVDSVEELPDDGSFIYGLVQLYDDPHWVVSWYFWNGTTWTEVIQLTFSITDEEFSSVNYIISAGWSMLFGGVLYGVGSNTIVINPATTVTGTVFNHGETGCEYSIGTITVPPQLYWYAEFLNPNPGDQFSGWLINGEPLWENNTAMQAIGGGSVYWIFSAGNNPERFLLWVVQEVAPSNAEVIVLDGLGDPVALTWQSIAQTTCYGVDTAIADPNITVRSLNFTPAGLDADWVPPVTYSGALFDDPQFEVDMDAFVKALNGPQAAFTIGFSGGNVRMQTTNAYVNLQGVNFFADPFTISLVEISCP